MEGLEKYSIVVQTYGNAIDACFNLMRVVDDELLKHHPLSADYEALTDFQRQVLDEWEILSKKLLQMRRIEDGEAMIIQAVRNS